MFKFYRFLIALICFKALWASQTIAQSRISLAVTQNTYVGDLNPAGGSFYNPSSVQGQLGFDFGFEYAFDESVYLVAEVGFGSYEANYSLRSTVDHLVFDDNYKPEPHPRFIEGSFLQAQVGFNWIFYSSESYQIYTGLGFGLLDFTIKDLDGRNLRQVSLLRATGETYPRIVTQLPLRMGFQLFTNYRFNVGYELSWTFTNSDYLDNIGQYGKNGSDALFKNQIRVRYRLFNK
jgi:hypothetical protein